MGAARRIETIWKWLSTCVVFFSLLCTVTNFVPLSVSYAVLLPALPFLLYRAYKRKRLTPLHVWLLIVYAYFAFCTLRFDAGSFFSYAFYRRDGSFFPLFVPILLFSLMEWTVTPTQMVKAFTIFASALNLLLLVWRYLLPASYPFIIEGRLFFSLFESHNGAGGFLLGLSCCAFGLFFTQRGARRKLLWGTALAFDLLGLFMTDSRGSTLGAVGIVFALAWLLLKDRGCFKRSKIMANLDILVFLSILACFMVIIGIVYSALTPMDVYETCILNDDYYAELPTKLQDTAASQKISWMLNDGLTRSGTIIDRLFFLWPRAMDLFMKSPIVGMGTGSYNDLRVTGKLSPSISTGQYTFAGRPGLVMKVVNDNVINSSAHAHNSYLHVMAENGILGLLLILLLCFQLRKTILALPNPALRLSLYACMVGFLIASFFENRMFAPAQMLPFVLVLGIAMAETPLAAKNRAETPEPAA